VWQARKGDKQCKHTWTQQTQEKTKTKAQRQKSGLTIHVFEFLLVGKPSTVKVKRQPSK
jgi:hypothetical protein